MFLQNGWKHTISDADAPGDAEPKEGGAWGAIAGAEIFSKQTFTPSSALPDRILGSLDQTLCFTGKY